jgi:hypothetical protein
MMATLLKPPLDERVLPASDALAFVDGATGEVVTTGLICSLVLRRDRQLLGRSHSTPSGVHHWPDLSDRWRQPTPPVRADVFVRDELERFQPLSLPWPLPVAVTGQIIASTVFGAARLLRVSLLSAPGRQAPPGLVSIYGQLSWQADDAPVAWARVSYVDGAGRVRDGASDAQGRLALHLPRPRPDKAGSPPEPAAQLHVYADPDLADDGVPDVLAFAEQPEVLALSSEAMDDAYVPPAFIAGEPLILFTLGLPPARRELRLKPL